MADSRVRVVVDRLVYLWPFVYFPAIIHVFQCAGKMWEESVFMTSELANYVYERDRAEFNLGDTIDIKTGLILASLTFLAIQLGDLMKDQVIRTHGVAQMCSVFSIVALIAGAILSIVALWPRNYYREADPKQFESWMKKMDEYHRDHPETPTPDESLTRERVSLASDRIQVNSSINRTKATLMLWAFFATVIAFVANLISLMATRLF